MARLPVAAMMVLSISFGLPTATAQSYHGKSCPQALSAMVTDLNTACCSPLSNCASGSPKQCSQACARLYQPFYRACSRFIHRQGGGLSSLAKTCSHAKNDAAAVASTTCPRGYKKFGDNCYLFSLDKATYDVAEKACEALGGELACVESKEENDFLTSNLQAKQDYWIGFHDVTAGYHIYSYRACSNVASCTAC
jgi:hypothetical protein